MEGVDDGELDADAELLEEGVIVDVMDGELVDDVVGDVLCVLETVTLLEDVLHDEADGEADPLLDPL